MHRKHLQEIPDQSSNVTTSFTWGWDSSKTSELLSGMGVSALEKEEVDSENIPHGLLSNLGHPQSPPRKRVKSKGSDKDFVIIRRPKLNRENFPGVSWDSLPDELLLGIFSCLCLPELLRVSGVCKRWYRLSSLRVQHMDLSNSVINVSNLHRILSECSKLQNLSLEGLQLSDPIVNTLAQNENLVRLNLCGCSGFSESAVATLLSSCSRLDELNLSWCFDFTEKHVQAAVAHLPDTITQLNLSGYRKNLQKTDLCTIIKRCPNLIRLDLSDSIMLKNDCFPEFFQLNYLQHLSLSRCYDIIPDTLLELGDIPTLKTLQVFGIVPDGTLQLLREALPRLQINCAYFTSIARPTMDNKKNPEIWGIKCRLTLQKPSL
ncbi:S-phase kinase-associated protein 2 isoform X2 [Mastomys coucha]|uniref:S-phase kinase-associated protein 2 isoform X2 n=1 Tax=Mastomys coucha TaxID=35658 RepID=UPI001261A93F|nr:S-phase kinase-associated protein 2 isoform X2 [Mastomys coucha]